MTTTERVYPLCAGGCGRKVRQPGENLVDHPGTLSARAQGHCISCWKKHGYSLQVLPGEDPVKAAKRHVSRQRPIFNLGDPCKKCSRALRPRRMKVAEAPGTIRHYGQGMCDDCYAEEVSTVAETISGELKKIPGYPVPTVSIDGRRLRTMLLPPRPENMTQEERQTRDWVEQMIDDRRRRGIPPQGLDVEQLGEKAA